VTARALMQRINRRLAKDEGSRLLTCRETARGFNELGRYYVVNAQNHLAQTDVDLEDLARELDLMKPWETLVEN
jgi:hypothetical protein